MTTPADTLRRNLPRLHKAGLCTRLAWAKNEWWMFLGDDEHVVDGVCAVTHAIGAIVEALHNVGRLDGYVFVLDPEDSVLDALLIQAEFAGLIAPLEKKP